MSATTSSPPPLARPPAVEVIYGLHAVTPTDLVWEQVEAVLKAHLPQGFHLEQPITTLNIQVTTQKDNSTSETRSDHWAGVRVVSADGSITGHFMRNGLFVNFSKYPGYDEAIGPVQQLWVAFCKAFDVTAVMQLSIRYINVIRLPFNSEDRLELNEYFRLVLQFPDDLKASMRNFHHQLTIVTDKDMPARIMLSSMREDDTHLVVAFDNEGYREGQWNADSLEIWNTFHEVRDGTYHIFQSILTDKCRAEIGV